MLLAAAVGLLLLVVLAVAVTVSDAVRSHHWRVVAVERRGPDSPMTGQAPA